MSVHLLVTFFRDGLFLLFGGEKAACAAMEGGRDVMPFPAALRVAVRLPTGKKGGRVRGRGDDDGDADADADEGWV